MVTGYDPTVFDFQNFLSGTLTSDITSGTLTINVDTVPSPSQGILVIDPNNASSREIIFYTSKGVSSVTCPADGRGWDGSTAASHLTGTTYIMADVAAYFKGLRDGTLSNDPMRTSIFFDYIVSGGVIAISSGLIGTFSNITFYQNGRRYSGTSIANKTYTASKDTYVDITGNADGTITVTYTEAANNAASPALSANNLRVGIVVTSGAAITSINQGSPSATAPTVSSNILSVTDSLGNLIYPLDPFRKIIGYRQITANATATTPTDIAGLNFNCIVPNGRKVKVSGFIGGGSASVANNGVGMILVDVTGSANIATARNATNASGDLVSINPVAIVAPGAGTRNYKAQLDKGGNAATANTNSSATNPSWIMAELV